MASCVAQGSKREATATVVGLIWVHESMKNPLHISEIYQIKNVVVTTKQQQRFVGAGGVGAGFVNVAKGKRYCIDCIDFII